MVEYYNNILCIDGGWLYKDGNIMSVYDYKNHLHANKMIKLRHGGNGRTALIDYNSIPDKYKEKIVNKIGDPYQKVSRHNFEDQIKPDPKAKEFFDSFIDNKGRHLKEKQRIQYYNNTIIIQALIEVANSRIKFRKALGGSYRGVWKQLGDVIINLNKDVFPHNLPTHYRRLKSLADKYLQQGYSAFLHAGLGNPNSRKVNDAIERLLLSIYVMENRPFASWVQDYYLQFLAGAIEVVDCETGEIFDRQKFFDNDGKPITISESTAWNYLRRPDNQALVNKLRKSGINYKTKETAYNHRHRPNFSLSKISFDDRTLPRKSEDKRWVQAYYAYDPMSECFIGTSYSLEKDINLVYDCFRNMYSTLEMFDLPWPAESEVEHHLMSGIKPQLDDMFAFVHFCNPQNSREKRAEHGIRLKKYGTEKADQNNIGRWSNASDAYQVNQDKIEKISIEQLIADDKQSVLDHNHKLHSNQKRFPKKTRWEVLMENVNPELSRPVKRIIFKHLGFRTDTSIRNNDFVRCQYHDYAISAHNILSMLKPNKYEVQAYYIPNNDGSIPEVYLYQDDTFLCVAKKYESYNEALAERTERDEKIRSEQAVRQARQRKAVKEGLERKISKVNISKNDFDYDSIEAETVESVPEPVLSNDDFDWNVQETDIYKKRAINDL
jgi:hypothetical protein